jgi:hypothetical protein
MHRCPQCHFPCPATATHCGWCAQPLVAQHVAPGVSPYPPAPSALPPPFMAAPFAAPPLPATPPPAPLLASAPFSQPAAHTTGAIGAQHVPLHSVATSSPVAHPAWSSPPGYTPLNTAHVTGMPPSLPAWGGAQRSARAGWGGWWLCIPVATLCLAWTLVQGQPTWGHMLTTAARVGFAGAVVLGIVALALGNWHHAWRAALAPLAVGALLAGLGGAAWALAQPLTYLQAQRAEHHGNFVQAIDLYLHLGDATDAMRVRVAWGQAMTDQLAFTNAQGDLNLVLNHTTSGPLHDAARAALGHLFWTWGQALYAKHDLPGTRAKWAAAVALAAGTTDGDRAAAALNAPQPITGHMVWHGQPLAGEQIALASTWHFTPELHILQVQGPRLETTTGDDGSFTITNALPNVPYILIWQGSAGDMTRVDAQGNPLYTITLQPLQGGDLGQISIDNS